MDVSENGFPPKSSNLIGMSIIFTIHFGGFPPICGNTHMGIFFIGHVGMIKKANFLKDPVSNQSGFHFMISCQPRVSNAAPTGLLLKDITYISGPSNLEKTWFQIFVVFTPPPLFGNNLGRISNLWNIFRWVENTNQICVITESDDKYELYLNYSSAILLIQNAALVSAQTNRWRKTLVLDRYLSSQIEIHTSLWNSEAMWKRLSRFTLVAPKKEPA